MTAHRPRGKRTSRPSKATSAGKGPPAHLAPVHEEDDDEAPSALDALREELTTLDALAHYAVNNLEDAYSDDQRTRNRYGAVIGLLADHAAAAWESAHST
jgi:hypothetical protein